MYERMDFDIGTLIYILITLIAVIAGALGKKKKTTGTVGAASPKTSDDSSEGGFISKLEHHFEGFVDEARHAAQDMKREFIASEDVLEEIQDDDYQFAEDLHEERKSEEETVVPSAFAKYEGAFDPDMVLNHELVEAEAERTTGLEVIQLDEESHADYYQIVKDFDLGTAVIYSAIINRPDY